MCVEGGGFRQGKGEQTPELRCEVRWGANVISILLNEGRSVFGEFRSRAAGLQKDLDKGEQENAEEATDPINGSASSASSCSDFGPEFPPVSRDRRSSPVCSFVHTAI